MNATESPMGSGPKTCKSCDQCRRSKVRCTMVQGETGIRCTNCIKRGELCRFKEIKRKLRRQPQPDVPEASNKEAGGHHGIGDGRPTNTTTVVQDAPSIVSFGSERGTTSFANTPQPPRTTNAQADALPTPRRLFIDEIIDRHQESAQLTDGRPYIIKQSPQIVVPSSCLAFWSERKIASISEKIGTSELRDLIDKIEAIIRGRTVDSTEINFREPKEVVVSPPTARKYIQAYFDHVHPMYPFLDRAEFEQAACNTNSILSSNAHFSALYHAVLALGCQYCVGGSFDPGKGQSWMFFQKSLSLLPVILVPRECLFTLQALVAMAVFSQSTCCLQIDEILLLEAARVSVTLWYHKSRCLGMGIRDETTCHRTFWVLYTMEKQLCLDAQRHSMFADEDIGSPIPWTPESVFSGYNSFHSSIRFARISSIAYTSLFTVSGAASSVPQYHSTLDHVQGLLLEWLASVPEDFRPGKLRASYNFSNSVTRMVFLQTSYRYYYLVIALARLRLHLDDHESGQDTRRHECKTALISSARAVIELTRYIDIDAHTPVFILTSMPMASLFILFDFVIHNPAHIETQRNLLLLDVVAGHFSRLEYASDSSLPASILSKFSHLAKQYVDGYGKPTPDPLGSKEETDRMAEFYATPETESSSAEMHVYPPNPLLLADNSLPWGREHHTVMTSGLGDIESMSYPSVEISDTEMEGLMSGFDFRSLFGHTFANPASLTQMAMLDDSHEGMPENQILE